MGPSQRFGGVLVETMPRSTATNSWNQEFERIGSIARISDPASSVTATATTWVVGSSMGPNDAMPIGQATEPDHARLVLQPQQGPQLINRQASSCELFGWCQLDRRGRFWRWFWDVAFAYPFLEGLVITVSGINRNPSAIRKAADCVVRNQLVHDQSSALKDVQVIWAA